MDYLQAIADLEGADALHEARLLLLVRAFDDGEESHGIGGLTKLAKLDFLLRYPVMLEDAMRAKNKSVRSVKLQDHESSSVESKMVRYRFGPWDHRYRRLLNLLMAKGLVAFDANARPVRISLTTKGRDVAERLASDREFELTVERTNVLRKHFDMLGTNLMKFIYNTFPDILSLRANRNIDI